MITSITNYLENKLYYIPHQLNNIDPFRWISSYFTAEDTLFNRSWEVLPGPFTWGWPIGVAKEHRALDLLTPLIEGEDRPIHWTQEDVACVQNLIDQTLQEPNALRKLEYRDDRAFFFLKGALQVLDPETLKAKIDALEASFENTIDVRSDYRLNAWDCGALESAAKWTIFLQKLKDLGVQHCDPLIAQWIEIAKLYESPTPQKLKDLAREALTARPVSVFLVGKAEWAAWKLHSDLGSMPAMDALKHIFTGNGTHTGFIVREKEDVISSHHVTRHSMHGSSGFLDGTICCVFLNVSIRPLLPSNIDETRADRLEEFFLNTLHDRALIQRTLSMKNKVWAVWSQCFGAKTPRSENFSLSETEYCTGYMAKVLVEAWDLTNQESLRSTGYALQPIFGPHDAIGRMSIPQLMHLLKSKGCIHPIQQQRLDQALDRDRLFQYWQSL